MSDKELLQILLKKRKFVFIDYNEILKKDGVYYMIYNHLSETIDHYKQFAQFLFDNYGNIPVIEIKNSKPVRFGNNFKPTDEEINRASELYKHTKFIFLTI